MQSGGGVRVDTPLKIAVARQHAHGNQITLWVGDEEKRAEPGEGGGEREREREKERERERERERST